LDIGFYAAFFASTRSTAFGSRATMVISATDAMSYPLLPVGDRAVMLSAACVMATALSRLRCFDEPIKQVELFRKSLRLRFRERTIERLVELSLISRCRAYPDDLPDVLPEGGQAQFFFQELKQLVPAAAAHVAIAFMLISRRPSCSL
jgi:hypothetical protein